MNTEDLDRRTFLARLGRLGGGACLACGVAGAFSRGVLAAPPGQYAREVDHYEKLPGGKVQCLVCPRHCLLADGEGGFCRARINVKGRHFNRAYNNPCILKVDPIEKLPLNHFLPGSQTLTIAAGGCNVRCLYCQNWQQSQKSPDELQTFELSPTDAVASAGKKEIDTIAFGYTEPVAFLEYAKDIAIEAKKAGLRVVAASSAFVEPAPLLEFAEYVDAFVLSLKGFDDEFYHRVVAARLGPVLRSIETIKKETNCWLELVNLVVPTYNDDLQKIGQMAGWIHDHVGDDVPLHFERFTPMYRLKNLPRTPVPTLEAACDAARKEGLRYVYTSNIAPHEGTNTVCAKCGTPVIERLGFKILKNKLRRGICAKCRNKLPGVWD